MYEYCVKNIQSRDPNVREKRGILDVWRDLKESFVKFYEGWKKATSNKSSGAELKRIYSQLKDLAVMIWKWNFTFGDMKKCKGAADIYHKAVETFGVYRYRVQSKNYWMKNVLKTLDSRRKSFLEHIFN